MLNHSSPSIDVLNLSIQSYNCLQRSGMHTVAQVAALSAGELLAIRQLGPKALTDIREKLAAYLAEHPLADEAEESPLEPETHTTEPFPPQSPSPLLHPTPLDVLGLSVRPYNALMRRDITTVEQLARMADEDVTGVYQLGPKSLAEIQKKLQVYLSTNPTLAIEPPKASGESDAQPATPLSKEVASHSNSPRALHDDFVEHLSVAHEVALKTRESQIFDLRYGLSDGEPLSLAGVGEIFDLSRERISQLLRKAHGKIRGRGRRKIRKGEYDDPCAQLILYLEETIRPSQPGHIDRLTAFVLNELPHLPTGTHALRLVARLVYPSKNVAVSCEREAGQRIRELRRARRSEHRQRKAHEKLEGLLSYATWPSQVDPLSLEQVQSMRRKRSISENSKGVSGCYFSQKLKREIQYESQIEFDFLLRLEELKTVLFYQEQPFVVPYSHGGRVHSYYPDVFFLLEDGRGVVVEIKPVFEMALYKNLRKWSALREFCNERGLGLLITDGRYTIQQVRQRNINRRFAKEVLSALELGPLSWDQYRGIRNRHEVTSRDFLALVLRKRLVWELSPFRLSKHRDHIEQQGGPP